MNTSFLDCMGSFILASDQTHFVCVTELDVDILLSGLEIARLDFTIENHFVHNVTMKIADMDRLPLQHIAKAWRDMKITLSASWRLLIDEDGKFKGYHFCSLIVHGLTRMVRNEWQKMKVNFSWFVSKIFY